MIMIQSQVQDYDTISTSGIRNNMICGFLQPNLALISPSIDPIKPAMVINKQMMLNVLSTIHFLVQGLIFFCTKYISTGKYMANGQKLKAPNTPNTWLK